MQVVIDRRPANGDVQATYAHACVPPSDFTRLVTKINPAGSGEVSRLFPQRLRTVPVARGAKIISGAQAARAGLSRQHALPSCLQPDVRGREGRRSPACTTPIARNTLRPSRVTTSGRPRNNKRHVQQRLDDPMVNGHALLGPVIQARVAQCGDQLRR